MKIFKELSIKRYDAVHWIPRLLIVVIIGQTLPFKFLGAEESVWIFEQLEMEPNGRLIIATVESFAVILLLTRLYVVGAIISLSVLSTANFYHFTRLGIAIGNDGGTLFWLSVIVVLCSLWIIFYWNVMRKGKRVTFKTLSTVKDLEELPIDNASGSQMAS